MDANSILRRNPLPWIAAYSFGLGWASGCSAFGAFALAGTPYWPLFAYVSLLTLFHLLEYQLTAIHQPVRVSLDAFLLNHSPEYHAAHASAIAEFLLETVLGPWWFGYTAWSQQWLQWLGLMVALAGQLIRTLSMHTAGSGFTHDIATEKEPSHQLTTHGIYRFVRHPSYMGFWLWASGTQLCLWNPVCFVGFQLVLYRYFSERIEYEEHWLQQFFGSEYSAYRARVPFSGVPFCNSPGSPGFPEAPDSSKQSGSPPGMPRLAQQKIH